MAPTSLCSKFDLDEGFDNTKTVLRSFADVKYPQPEYKVPDEVDVAGDLFIDPVTAAVSDSSFDEWSEDDWERYSAWNAAYDVLNNWRASHSFPLNVFYTTLRDRAQKIDATCLLAQRIKRLPSIRAKLQRRKFRLSEIQDIGGCRAILSSVQGVDRLIELYERSALKHHLVRKDDYIRAPKVSGYRGVHLVYGYYSDRKPTYNGLKIEMQVRSRLQHAWATSVETVDIFTGQALKSKRGNRKWQRFFQLMGSSIALREQMPLVPNTPSGDQLVADLRRYVKDLGVIDHLHAYNTALKYREIKGDIEEAHYFLLKLDPSANRIVVTGFKSTDIGQAQKQYQEIERQISNVAGDDVVLVSAESMDSLRRAFPNYFLDTNVFIAAVKHAIEPS